MMNRLGSVSNPYQGSYKKVLCVCSAGILRSPTAALVLSKEPFNFNTRAVGVDQEFALIPIDKVLMTWADEIVCMTGGQMLEIKNLMVDWNINTKPVKCLNIPDQFDYRHPGLEELIAERYQSL